MKSELFRKMEVLGIIFVMLMSLPLRYIYIWAPQNVTSLLFGAINNSVWENIKVFAMPYVVWSILELAIATPYFKQFVISKVTGLYMFSITYVVISQVCKAFIPTSSLAVSLVIALVCVVLAFVTSYNITMADTDFRAWFTLCVLLLLLYFIMYFCFSAAAPKLELFKDPQTGLYGIPSKGLDVGAFILTEKLLS